VEKYFTTTTIHVAINIASVDLLNRLM